MSQSVNPGAPTAPQPGAGSEQEASNRYKATLNLPKTAFAMKANLVQNEPASQKRWEDAGLYAKVQQARASGERFVFHDGPPYANGSIHLGHMLNKCLKDLVVRSRLMEGMSCPFIPGWDCHGLPIEHKVMTELSTSGKLAKLATLEEGARRMAIRRECAKYVEKYMKQQSGEMRRLLTLADYADPYFTMDKRFEGATLEVFADLVEQGLVYRQLKPVHWSTANETALAEAELEYEDREDLSVYVDFEAADADAVYDAFGLGPAREEEEDEEEDGAEPAGLPGGPGLPGVRAARPGQRPCFMIWTTTPWTLPANLAIAVNPEFEYALVRIDGNVTVMARDLVEKVTRAAKAEDVAVLATTQGSNLVGLRYRHPFIAGGPDFGTLLSEHERERHAPVIYRVVPAGYVTLDDGTGLVHTAPGHGEEDYHTGLRESLPIYCPVLGNGKYDDSVPEFLRGKDIWEANALVVQTLRNSGHLFFDHKFTHSYPHDWRGKSPVIFRATEQWFIGVDRACKRDGKGLRHLALETTAHDVKFVPEWGRNRMRGMLESRPDWCISRQRAWGLPIPAFHAADGTILLTSASVRAVALTVREKGSDCWFTETPAALLSRYDYARDPDAPKGLDLTSLRKSSDIFDVWFESGSSWNSVIRERLGRDAYPCDLYLEGSDQHRGWFQLSLLPALGVTGKAPFRTLLTHGFIVDKDGRKMSKSVGNTLEVEKLVKEYGADVCRWWVASLSFENDIKADLSFFSTAGEAYRKVRNTLRFMLSNLDDFTVSAPGAPGHCVATKDIPPSSIDAWALGQLEQLERTVRSAYRDFDFRGASSAIYNFCNDTLSSVYLAAIKDRLYCDAPGSPRRRRTQTVLWDITDSLCRLLAPIMPHTADEAWRALVRRDGACVHEQTFSEPCGVRPDEGWSRVRAVRDQALRALEVVRKTGDLDNPLDAGLVLPDADGTLARFDATDLADLMGVSRVTIDKAAAEVKVVDLRREPRCERSWKRDGTVKVRSDGGQLCERCAQAVGVN